MSVEDCYTVVYIGLVCRKEALAVARMTHNGDIKDGHVFMNVVFIR